MPTTPVTPTRTPLAPWPATRTGDDDNPFTLPTPKEGETVPPVMITQDVTTAGRTVSTNYDPADQLEPVPPGTPAGGEAPATATVPVSSSDIAALSTTPLTLVPAPAAGASLEFQSATGTYTYGTTTYTGTGTLQIKCGTVVVSSDVPATVLTGAASGPVAFTALPGLVLTPDQPITLSLTGGSLVGGDGTLSLDVTTSTHPPAAASANGPAVASASAAPPSTLAPRSAQPGHALGIRKGAR